MAVVDDGMVFPNVGLRTLSAIVHFLGTAVLAACLSRRVAFEDLNTLRGWRNLSVARLTIILIFADSLAFLMITGVLIHGTGLEESRTTCSLGIFSCIALYTSSKVLIYIFLSEKVWLVWSNMASSQTSLSELQARSTLPSSSQHPATSTAASHSVSDYSQTILGKRLHSRIYLLCIISVLFYFSCFVLLLVYRIANLRASDGSCEIGLKKVASIPLLSYDVSLCVALAVEQTCSGGHTANSERIYGGYSASVVALTTSAVNIAVLTSLQGHELGWVCLASCGTDVMINALVLDWVTESRLKKIMMSRHDRARALMPGDTFPISGGGKSYPNASLRPPRTNPLNETLDLANHGTTHSVDFRLQDRRNSSDSGTGVQGPSMSLQSKAPSAAVEDPAIDSHQAKEPSASARHSSDSEHQKAHHGEPCDCDHINVVIDDDDDDIYSIPPSPSSPATPKTLSSPPPRKQSGTSPRLLSFQEILSDAPARGAFPPRMPFAARVPKPKKSWSRSSAKQNQLPVLHPMAHPTAAGYLGTGPRRMSMPLTPDDIDLEDFDCTPPPVPAPASSTSHSIMWNAASPFAPRRPPPLELSPLGAADVIPRRRTEPAIAPAPFSGFTGVSEGGGGGGRPMADSGGGGDYSPTAPSPRRPTNMHVPVASPPDTIVESRYEPE
ncbi:hypothetical protein DL93DRAFT_2095238 [Clavulina sp. PMI_390]|nr:hypothetical protein DL93DRAFT_2095238 [Clavulina sp. PMI_390]